MPVRIHSEHGRDSVEIAGKHRKYNLLRYLSSSVEKTVRADMGQTQTPYPIVYGSGASDFILSDRALTGATLPPRASHPDPA